jgi:hypothetical protein
VLDRLELVHVLQEPPSTSLTGLARDIYEATKATINAWEPAPCPPDWRPTP